MLITTKPEKSHFPYNTGLTIHAQTRKHDLIDIMLNLGLSIFYDQVLDISTAMDDCVCDQYHHDGIDSTSSTTATGSFHETEI